MGMVTIVLHGKLREQYDKTVRVYADTIREAITALSMIDAFNPAKQTKRFLTKVDGCSVQRKLDEPIETNTLHLHCDVVEDVNFASGSGNNPYVNIIIGAILVVIGVIITGMSFGGAAPLGMAFISAGVGLIVGGIMQIINPVEEPEIEENTANKSVTRYPNTVASGTVIPLIVGKHKHGGHIFSLNTMSRSSKNMNLSGLVSELDDFEGSWVTMHSQLTEDAYNSRPSGGSSGGGGGGSWNNVQQR